MNIQFVPKLFSIIKDGYTKKQFSGDLQAGIIVGIIALPLAIAFAIASGVPPEKGLITAIIAGFVIAVLGGSRVNVSGPTGAFIVIVYGIVQKYGIDGLIISTFIAGVMLMIMGFARLGSVIKFIPHPLVVGFTSGIAILIFSSQVKDLFGLKMGTVPADFVEKWIMYFKNFSTVNPWAIGIAVATMLLAVYFKKITTKIPGSLIAVIISTMLVQFLHLPVETIESKFGSIPSSLPLPMVPHITFSVVQQLIVPAFTIAMLGAIESLLSAVVSDGMINANHRSNMELIAQGAGNIFSSIFGGIPATGAIARTAANIKNGGRTPVAAIIHAIVLLIIMLFIGQWAKLIPLSCLAGILAVVAYNMSEWRSFVSVVRGPRTDVAILLTTFFLTVIIDLTVALEIGMILAAFLFMHKMSEVTNIQIIDPHEEDDDSPNVLPTELDMSLPKGILIYEINGPLFFGVAHKFKDALVETRSMPKVLIIRMRNVSTIDATGTHYFKEMIKEVQSKNTKVILSGISPQILNNLKDERILFLVGKNNIFNAFSDALIHGKHILNQESKKDEL
jgi:sulfate permease, SulP family